MKAKKIIIGTALSLLAAVVMVGCGQKEDKKGEGEGKTTITFWAAPNPTQLKYWEEMGKEFEKENSDIIVKVSQMKESPSSEATIQSAIASKTAPTISENINRSFGAQLAASEAILPLNKIDGLDEIVSKRNMTTSFKTWSFSDGNQYVFPVYSNPIMFAWRTDVLKDLGVMTPPKTYSELLVLGEKLKEKYPDKVMWAKGDLTDPTAWMRWFDFFPLYNAASEGNNFIEDGKLVTDDKAGIGVLDLMASLQKDKLLLTGESTDPFENQVSIMADMGPWTFPNWAEKYPEMIYGETFEITPPVVPDEMKDTENIATYADAKGIVMYAQATEAEQKAAMKFLDFVYSDVVNDVKFFETTSLIPARDDAADNEAFQAYFKEHPEMKAYAESVPFAIPAIDNAKYNDLQQKIGEEAWVPVNRGEKNTKDAWDDMKKAIEGVLQ